MQDKIMSDPQISVIIPMYNCADFVHECLTMFREQTFTDFEAVCAIDGATDNTEEEVRKFCENDERFRYVLRENGGAGAARNTGIDHARGKYVIFCDADDIYDKNLLLKLYEAALENNAEIAVCGSETFDYLAGEKIEHLTGFKKNELEEGKVYSGIKKKHIMNMIDVQICNRLFQLDFIKKQGLKFSETISSNDLFFSRATIACAGRIVFVHDDLITKKRFFNADSISSGRGKTSENALKELRKMYNWMKERDLLKYFLSDYLVKFNDTSEYEMKNGTNPLFAEEMAHILNADEPWKYLNGSQIIRILNSCMIASALERIIYPADNDDTDEVKRIRKRNEIAKQHNQNKLKMQEMIKKASLELYGRDLDDPESESPVYLKDRKRKDISNDDLSHKSPPTVTVVIPMYNCAGFADKMLSMFAAQSFADFEVICIIDGATDKTEEVVKEFCKNDSRFICVVQENKGFGAARNAGLDMARGEYILFSNVYDEYSTDYLKKLYETAVKHDAQVVVCRFIEKNIITQKDTIKGFDKNMFFENIPYSHYVIDNLFLYFNPQVQNKLFNINFIRNKEIRFPELKVPDDSYFSYTAFSVSDKIVFIRDTLYTFRIYLNSEPVCWQRERYQHESVDVLRMLYKWLKEHSLLEYHTDDYLKRVNAVLGFEGGYKVTLRFISEFAHMINAEPPWDTMTSEDILWYLEEGILATEALRKATKLSRLAPSVIESDSELSYMMTYCKNRIHTAKLLQQVSKDRYGRNFHTPESLPFATEKNEITIIRQGSQSYFDNMCLAVNWTITDDCNYRCSYCFFSKSGHKKNYCSLEQAETTLKHIAAANRPFYDITLLGGEPSLHPNFPEIINLCTDYLGNRLNKICIITNGNFGERTISSLKEAAQHTGIILIISIHFEFAQIDKLVHIVEELSDKVTISFKVMLHPDIFEKIQNTFNRLCELRKKHKFNLNITLLREPPGFVNIDSRYDDTHLLWIGNARKHFKNIKCDNEAKARSYIKLQYYVDRRIGNSVLRENVDQNTLESLTGYEFKGMSCCAGVSIIKIETDGTAYGMVCDHATKKDNIFHENPFIKDDWLYAVKCQKKRCSCSTNHRIPKFYYSDEADDFIKSCQKKQLMLTKVFFD